MPFNMKGSLDDYLDASGAPSIYKQFTREVEIRCVRSSPIAKAVAAPAHSGRVRASSDSCNSR